MSDAPPSYVPADFQAEFDVPRGTMDKFVIYADLLGEWQSRMNLVGPATLADTWSRHFRDSAQLLRLAPASPGRWLDIGSGAGFPALVIALLSDAQVHAVEATTKKCRFLEAVIAACDITNAKVHNVRIESLRRFKTDVISARACASLQQLFAWGRPFSTHKTSWIIPKGARFAKEIEEAEQQFRFRYTLTPSVTAPEARILVAKLDMSNDR